MAFRRADVGEQVDHAGLQSRSRLPPRSAASHIFWSASMRASTMLDSRRSMRASPIIDIENGFERLDRGGLRLTIL
jgi:hypothetical protein